MDLRNSHVVVLLVPFLVAAAPAKSQAPEPRVEIVRPQHLSTVVGPATIEVRVELPDGGSAERIEVRIDGRLQASLTSPPWTVPWDAGDAAEGHVLEATAHLRGGASVSSSVRTSPLHINQVEKVDLVNLYPIVKDRKGEQVSGLRREDFRIYESGVLQTIERFSTERKPLRVAIVLDTSATMGRGKVTRLENAQRAALEFLEVLRPGDEGMVVSFSDSVEVGCDLTSDARLLARAIEQVEAAGGTALYDSIWQTANRLKDADGRRVLLLLSDGRDEAYNGLEPGSLHTLEEALDRVLRAEVTVFSVGLGRELDRECVFSMTPLEPGGPCPNGTAADLLRRVANTSGGSALLSPGANKLREAFQQVADDLRHQYSIAYTPRESAGDGFRPIQVAVVGRDVEITARAGYYFSRRSSPGGQASRQK